MKRRNSLFSVSDAVTRGRAGFSLVEILMAVMILGVGMIMIASVFPVGANWARQNIEESIGSNVAKNAVSIIQTKYTAGDLTTVGNALVALPKIGAGQLLPLSERAYAFGLEPPYPIDTVAHPGGLNQASYYWTAMIRRSGASATANSFDLYIFVFNKPDSKQTFTTSAAPLGRDATETNIPCLEAGPIANNPRFPVGSQGVGTGSGSAFRKIDEIGGTNIVITDAQAYYAPGADDSAVSPLVYIYQTTISF